MIDCKDQDEVDRYWTALGEGGEHGPCGWLKDRFGLSWQVIPARMNELLADPDPERASRAMQAMLKMGKLIVADLEKAADG
jgi:predicted 3-demethylubiquinone-9 3-methyltransferase (glyoxalase superfamily)